MRGTGLYKQLIRYGQQLQYTDKHFFYRRIRAEFEQNKNLQDKQAIQFQLGKKLDKSQVPVIQEKDLEEKFVRGWGPGGQAVNTTSNAVFLRHIPSGLFVKCHESRSLENNRKIARKHLITKLDNLVNGLDSVENRQKAIDSAKKERKKEKSRRKYQQLKLIKEGGVEEKENNSEESNELGKNDLDKLDEK
ncbi:probable peptide chain release factor C12orf65, mitochondrial [Eurytemora carolleeae]|uniref:probable peptide chain release factor C12orf65, mitochondrial n=1 Tax=Eurytemora carolleeae TaxID=1294199 RepID=UPI000C76A71A|nr:probable peptide chain release factor C12orf65, mitochondrial [Eurytemora carolleeae]|eukprot:XP_023319833.1 probable peptide chain release factor C12orf65, mitochondrial [Eurytemora affinis]